jgi:ornithine carbamoyltransferase
MMTIKEVFGGFDEQHLVFIGDGNNVARSLANATAMLGLHLTIASPVGFELSDEFIKDLQQRVPTARIDQSHDASSAVRNADIVYTDVWASMGQEAEADRRKQLFAPFQVNAELMALAPSGCRFMHDLPAKRGLEVTDDVIDGPGSIVFQQAQNRMHLAKGLLAWLLNKGNQP